ncbi:uncharacterized protein METZ01_LOCUS153315 [marine metagenome]|uniref:Carboxyltransferase domain-containing protein n=1 Tax=marine metagenome TaxID=408172 RepID=A0A382AGQ6_9ZZZZ
MDYESFTIANVLVSNNKTEGVLEFAYQGPLLKLIKGQTKFAITGRVHFQIINSKNETINGECNRTYDLEEGEQVDILATNKSAYGYFAIEGGFSISPFCNSVSTLSRANIGPNGGKKINLKNKIFFKKNRQEKNNYIISVTNKNNNLIRVLRGPQHDYFSDSSKKDFCSKNYKISNITDRMGMRLEGTVLKNVVSTNIRSEGIVKGSIQVPADGQPIVLLNDHPTIGGYPKIANVISADYDLLVQNVPGTDLSFKYIELEEAESAFELYFENIKKTLETKSIIK